MTDDDGDPLTLADIIADPEAERMVRTVDELDFMEKRREAVETALASLPDHQQEAIRAKYYRGEKADMVAVNAALRYLRHPSRSKDLKPYLN